MGGRGGTPLCPNRSDTHPAAASDNRTNPLLNIWLSCPLTGHRSLERTSPASALCCKLDPEENEATDIGGVKSSFCRRISVFTF